MAYEDLFPEKCKRDLSQHSRLMGGQFYPRKSRHHLKVKPHKTPSSRAEALRLRGSTRAPRVLVGATPTDPGPVSLTTKNINTHGYNNPNRLAFLGRHFMLFRWTLLIIY
jgi:hypothetical protein